MIGIAVLGYGYWGPNLVRNFASMPDVEVTWVCDSNPVMLEKLAERHPKIRGTANMDDVFADKNTTAVAIAFPAQYHAEIALKAMEHGKHVFIEKPMTLSIEDSEKIVDARKKTGLVVMVGHLLLYNSAVRKMKELIDQGELGDILYLYSQRLNLGLVRTQENALWSLATHDISVALYLLGESPVSVSSKGQWYLSEGVEDTVFTHMRFPGKKMAHMHVSWLDPHRVRRLTVVGEKKMAVLDDVEPSEKLKVFDKGVQSPQYRTFDEVFSLRFGDITIPYVKPSEPLKLECRHFVDCVMKGEEPLSGAASGLEVVRVLDAAQRSLKNGGNEVYL